VDGEPSIQQSRKAVKSITTPYQGWFREDQFETVLKPFKERYALLSADVRRQIADAEFTGKLHSSSQYYHEEYSVKFEYTDEELRAKLGKAKAERIIKGEKNKAGKAYRRPHKSLADVPYGHLMTSLLTEEWSPQALASRTPVEGQRMFEEYGIDSGYAGAVRGMQKQGCKLRTVVIPTARLQADFMPMHKSLQYAYQQMFPKENCCEDQLRGARAIKDHLDRGNSVYSVDLSSATDRFPRAFSEAVLDVLGMHRYADALEEVCLRPWKNLNLQGPSTLYYEVGQPMGLYGSFPLFHLSNLAVAEYAASQVTNCPDWMVEHPTIPFSDGTYFKIVGDDIVMSDSQVADRYRAIMEAFGVEISETKTFSGQVAEFAGFIAVPGRGGTEMFRPFKYPTGEWITDPLSYVHGLGSKVQNLGSKWKDIFEAYTSTLPIRDWDLSTVLHEPDEPVSHLIGESEWLDSLAEGIELQLNALPSTGTSKNLLRVQDYLSERSGYSFAGNTFSKLVDESIGIYESKPALNDYHFEPQSVIQKDRAEKRRQHELSKVERFWKDPLNSKWRNEVQQRLDGTSTHIRWDLTPEERSQIALVASKFQQLCTERKYPNVKTMDTH
jgi:hypothetical protein